MAIGIPVGQVVDEKGHCIASQQRFHPAVAELIEIVGHESDAAVRLSCRSSTETMPITLLVNSGHPRWADLRRRGSGHRARLDSESQATILPDSESQATEGPRR